MTRKASADQFINDHGVIIPGPVVGKRIGKAKYEDARKTDGSRHLQLFKIDLKESPAEILIKPAL